MFLMTCNSMIQSKMYERWQWLFDENGFSVKSDSSVFFNIVSVYHTTCREIILMLLLHSDYCFMEDGHLFVY